ncbi:uncharacterized protein LOC141601425 [Silene latifolia]|uniref:uncharacterized protein LOC141601425 n=1 Tax=Silene latifolia TaxID=37657 RepID=UPI003D77C926
MTEVQKQFVTKVKVLKLGGVKAYRGWKELCGGYDNIGATEVDFKNFVRDIKTYIGNFDAQMFVENLIRRKDTCSSFYFDFIVDENKCLARVFWADPICIKNYMLFGECIHVEAFDKVRKKMFWITMIYGFNKPAERESLWLCLKGYHQSINGPWITCGDFNSVMAIDKRIGGGPVSLADIKPLHFAHFLPEGLFDHFPCLISFEEVIMARKPALKYFNMWSKAHNFEEIIASNWKPKVHGTPMFQIVTKLKRLKRGLKALNKDQFSDIEKLTHVTELALLHFQTLLHEDPLNDGLCKAEKACAQEVVWMHQVRDEYLQQKAKVQCVLDGDDNTAYFHASIRKRRSRNKVYQVRDINDKLCSKYDEIKTAFEEYYVSLFGTSKQVTKVNKRVVQAGNCLNSQHCGLLMSPITSEEKKSAMFSIPGTKAPGPDGYSSQLFKDCWHIVGQEMVNYLGFSELWIKLIMQCISTPSYSIALNGETFGFFKGKKGLRQGDPLSPLLFTLCLEYFSRILAVTQQLPKFRFHPLCKRIGLSHLCFVDDFILFCKGEKTSIEPMINSFDYFSKASGLVLNTGKSNFYCNGMEDWLISEIARVTGMKKGSAPFKYLGVTVAPKRLSVLDCSCLVDKVVDRIKGLGARQLSYAGRLVLVKAVFSTLHNY